MQQASAVRAGFTPVTTPTIMLLDLGLLRQTLKKKNFDASKFPDLARFRAAAASFCSNCSDDKCEVSIVAYLKGSNCKVEAYQFRVEGAKEDMILAEKFFTEKQVTAQRFPGPAFA